LIQFERGIQGESEIRMELRVAAKKSPSPSAERGTEEE